MRTRALISGAGRGIGRAIAVRLSAGGCAVICSGRDVEALSETAGMIRDTGGEATVQALDLTDAAAIAGAAEKFGVLDTVVVNSGIPGPTAPLWQVEPAEWEETLQVNLTAGFLLCRALLPAMIERGRGSVVFVGSITASNPLPGRAPYAASKSALTGLVRSLALDAGPHGIRVNLVSPGPTAGERLDRVVAAQAEVARTSTAAVREAFLQRSPLHRFTEASDIAEAVAFLTSEGARAITGSEITVASGMVMS